MFGHGHHHHPPPPPAAGGGYPPAMPQQEQVFKIFCRADEAYCLTVRHDAVVLAPMNPRDQYQHWYKDMRHSTRVKDKEGNPAFALVNRATGLAIKHSLGQSHPVKLVPYNPEYLEESVLWTESKDVGKGFRCIRMVNNIRLNFDALHGDKDHGGVHDGTTVVLWEWCKGPNQSWKILPWGDEAYAAPAPPPAYGSGGYGYPGGSQAGGYAPPPPAQEPGYGYRPPPGGPESYPPPPPPAYDQPGYGYRPPPGGAEGYAPPPGNVPGYGYSNLPRALASEATVRVYCKAGEDYSLTVRSGTVCLAPTNPRDEFQHWVKDMRHSTSIKDEEGYPAFALVNKVTGEAIKHSLGQSHPFNNHDVCNVEKFLRDVRLTGSPCALQPGLRGRVGAVDGEPRRRARLPVHPDGEQHLPQLRRLPRRQGPRRRPRRHRDQALGVGQGRQPALEDRSMVERDVAEVDEPACCCHPLHAQSVSQL